MAICVLPIVPPPKKKKKKKKQQQQQNNRTFSINNFQNIIVNQSKSI